MKTVSCEHRPRFSKSMIITNNVKFTVYIAGTAEEKVSDCIVYTMTVIHYECHTL